MKEDNPIVRLLPENEMSQALDEIKKFVGKNGDEWFENTFKKPLISHAGKSIGASELLTIINKSLNGGDKFVMPAHPTARERKNMQTLLTGIFMLTPFLVGATVVHNDIDKVKEIANTAMKEALDSGDPTKLN